jgi:sigma-54 dependent transcriptional regulator, acetoin dehydrogenase operon transcriptional activator AcoR
MCGLAEVLMSALVLSNGREAWSRFVDGGQAGLELVRPEVARSWERCRELSVNPYEEIETRATQIDLRERLYKNQRLINVARPAMDNLFNFVRGSGFQVVLTDEQGFLLEVLGENELLSRTSTVDLCPGGNWSEAAKGTNAIGTAIVERAPVQIHAWEHYCQAHHFLTCSAAPIFDPDGELVGVLDMSGDYERVNAHTLGMVVAAVNAIENQLRLQRATEKLYTAYRYSNILLDSMSDGLISIDTNGVVTEMNARGGQIFGVNPALVKGRHISRIFPARPPVLQVISDGVGYEDREVVLDRSGRKIRSSASLLRDDAGNVIGAVAVFRPTVSALATKSSQPAQRYTFADIIGDSAQITAVKAWGAQAAASPSTVLIRGESGTGKELFAQAIHNGSSRSSQKFVAINCAALPDSLIESELFGHEEGSFTGAKKGGHVGKFELADGGTIFLDEVGEISLCVQAKLLRVLQERRVSRLGSTIERKVDIRVIAASNRDLYSEVQIGRFRQDLYYRLHVVELTVPPLRERVEDIPALATYLMRKLSAKFEREAFEFEDGFIAKLQTYHWPGNIRELENFLERAIARAGNGSVLSVDMIDLANQHPAVGTQQPAIAAPTDTRFAQVRTLAESEREMIAQALVTFEGNIQKTAAKLGIGRNTLYRKMKQYGLS